MTKILVNLTIPPKKSVKSKFISKKSVKNQAINCANQIKPLIKVISPLVNDTNTSAIEVIPFTITLKNPYPPLCFGIRCIYLTPSKCIQ